MRYAPEHNDAVREQILDAASRLFREHGIHAVGLARIMAEVGLTVGTFYTHFASKEALLCEALSRSLRARNREFAQVRGEGALEAAVRAYLSPQHRDGAGHGCPVAALAPELARHPASTRGAIAGDLDDGVSLFAALLAEVRGREVSPADAAAWFGLLVGTLQLARATVDPSASDALLDAGVRAALRLAA